MSIFWYDIGIVISFLVQGLEGLIFRGDSCEYVSLGRMGIKWMMVVES